MAPQSQEDFRANLEKAFGMCSIPTNRSFLNAKTLENNIVEQLKQKDFKLKSGSTSPKALQNIARSIRQKWAKKVNFLFEQHGGKDKSEPHSQAPEKEAVHPTRKDSLPRSATKLAPQNQENAQHAATKKATVQPLAARMLSPSHQPSDNLTLQQNKAEVQRVEWTRLFSREKSPRSAASRPQPTKKSVPKTVKNSDVTVLAENPNSKEPAAIRSGKRKIGQTEQGEQESDMQQGKRRKENAAQYDDEEEEDVVQPRKRVALAKQQKDQDTESQSGESQGEDQDGGDRLSEPTKSSRVTRSRSGAITQKTLAVAAMFKQQGLRSRMLR